MYILSNDDASLKDDSCPPPVKISRSPGAHTARPFPSHLILPSTSHPFSNDIDLIPAPESSTETHATA